MSTVDYRQYKIGTIGWEGPNALSQIGDMIVPTYGLWAGPGWSGGKRIPKGEAIDWETTPCMNNSITAPDADSNNCYSLMDAIAKHHDWKYYQAKQNGDDALMIIDADVEILNDIYTVSQLLQSNGTATYSTTKDGTIGSDGKVNLTAYTCTSLDATESKYITILAPAFAIKLGLWDTAKAVFSGVVNTFKSIWNIFGAAETTYEDGSMRVLVKEQNDGILYECDDNGKRTAVSWILDPDAEKTYTTAAVTFGEGGTRPQYAYEYLGNGECRINGGSAGDTITISDDITHQARLVLDGGDGEDRYIIPFGSSAYAINDTGDNHIIKKDAYGRYYEVGNFYKMASGDIWQTPDEKNRVTHASPWKILFEDGSTITLGEDFQTGDFGINLIDTPDAPTNTILGDLAPILPINYDSLGNVITDPNTPSPDRSDYLYDSTANDRIESKGGSDILHVIRGGDDLVIGGEGNDIVLAGEGDDNVFGENEGEMDDIIAAGETAQNINEKGDLASGGVGNDLVYGSNRKDALFGGEGFDLLVGGGGDDIVMSGNNTDGALFTWSYTTEVDGVIAPVFTNVGVDGNGVFDETGNEAIYAGTGNDFVYAAGGDDEVYAGAGNDTVFGWGGSDFIDGGDGDDVLIGDNDAGALSLDKHGDDYIDGDNIIQFRDKFKCGDSRQWGLQRECLKRAA